MSSDEIISSATFKDDRAAVRDDHENNWPTMNAYIGDAS